MALSKMERKQAASGGSTRYASQRPLRILLAEDDEAMRMLMAETRKKDGYEVLEVVSGDQLLASLGTAKHCGGPFDSPDLVISDIRMPGSSGLQVLERIRSRDWATPVILITAVGTPQTHMEAERLGATCVISKPLDLAHLRSEVRGF